MRSASRRRGGRRLSKWTMGIALVSVASSACSEPLEFADWTFPVPRGTRVVEYAAVPIEERTEQIGMVEDLVIGGVPTDDGALLHPRGYTDSAIALAEGKVFVLDNGNASVRAFDRNDGRYLFSLGAEGQGPGEFQRPAHVAISGGKLVVVDTRGQKLSFWSLTGEHIDDVTTPPLRLSRSIAGLADDSMIVRFQERQEENSVVVLARIDEEGTEVRRYLEAPGTRFDTVEVSGRNLVLSHRGPEAGFAVGAAGERVYVTPASEYQVAALSPAGELVWALRVASEAAPYPQDAIDRQIASMQEQFPTVHAGMFNWPERLPVLASVRVDGHDHLYVFPYVRSSYVEENGHRPVDVYSNDGTLLFSGSVRTTWDAADGDFVYLYEEREDTGEWAVVRYRLDEPFG